MRRSFLAPWLVCIILMFVFSSVFVSAQSQIPDDADQYLQITNRTGNGDTDGYQVVFFEVPDTMTDTLYFAVGDPGTQGPDRYPDENTADEAAEDTTYTLIGGSGALSDSTSREADYSSSGNDPTSAGTTLDSMTFRDETGWYYFDGVAPSQGEHIGSKYYFKIVAEVTLAIGNPIKNGFKFDVSTSDAVSTPTGSLDISAFAYAWSISLDDRQPEENGGALVWSMFPFVPDTATGNLVSHNWDADSSGTHEMYDTAGNFSGSVNVSGNPDEATTNFVLGGADTLGATWELRVTEETDDTPGYVNTTSYWHTNSVTGEIYRSYAAYYSSSGIDHVSLTTDDGFAVADNAETERVILQIVDSSGDPVSYIRDIYVTVNNSAIIDAVSDDTGYTPAQNALITTDSSGMGWLDVRDGTEETVTVTAYWNGTGSSSTFGTATSGSTTIDFLDFYALLSSASSTSFTVGDASTALPVITVTADTAKADSTFGLRIKIPDGLSAEFNTGVSPTLGGTISGITTGTSFPDTKTLRIGINGAIADGDTLTVTDLEMQNFSAASNGSLELSWDDGVSYPSSDDKLYIIDPAPLVLTRETVDLDSDGQIDGILMTTGEDLDDDFSAITVVVTGYTVSGYNTGAAAGSSANDDTFLVVLDESGTSDTGATPDVEITANTSLASSITSTLVPDDGGTPVASTDAAPPVLVSAASNFPVYGGNLVSGSFGSISYTEITLTFSEDVSVNSTPGSMSASDFKVEPDGTTAAGNLDGAAATVALGTALTDLVVSLSSDTTSSSWTSSGEIDLDTFTNVVDNNGNDAVENASTEVSISGLSATAVSWDGGGGDTDWNTAANWNPDEVPGESSSVTIPNTGAPWPVVPAGGASIFSLQIDTNAELSTGGNSLDVFDSFNLDGTLRRQGGDSVSHTDLNSGTVVYESSSAGDIQDYGATDYYNLSFEDAVSFSTGAELTVAGTLTVGDGTNASTLTAGGNVTADALVISSNSIFDAVNYDVTMTSSFNNLGQLRRYPGTSISRTDIDSGETVYYGADGQVQDYGAGDYFDLSIDGTGFTFSLADTLTVAGTLTVTNGTLETGAHSLSAAAVSVDDVLDAGGQTGTETFSVAGTTPDLSGTGSLTLGAGPADIDGDISITTLTGGSAAINVGGYFVPGSFSANTTTVVLDGTDTPVDLGSLSFNNLTISKSAEADEVSSLGSITVTGALSLSSGTWIAGAYTHSIAGDWDSSATAFSFTEAGSTILLTGASPAITTEGTTDPFENLEIDGDAVQGSDLSAGGTLTINTGGSLDTNDLSLSVTGNTTLSGTGELIGGTGTIDLGGNLGGTGVFSGGSGAVSIDGVVSNISSFTESSSTTTLSGSTVTFAASGFTSNSGTLIFDGTTTLTSNGETLGNVQIGTGLTGGSLTAADDLRIGGSFSVGTAATTSLDISSINMYVAPDLDLTNLDTFTVAGSTVYLNGAGNLTSAGFSFNNLSISGPGTVTLQDPLVVSGTLAISGGALDVNALGPYQVSVGGDWNNSVGAAGFVEQTGTVVLNNAGAIQNAETFYDLQVTAGTRTNSTGFSVSNNLTVSGTGDLDLSGGMSVTGTATISAGSVTADTGGTVSVGTLTLSGGDLTVNSPAALSVTTGDFTISNASSAFTGSGTVGVGTADLVVSDGSFTGSGSYTVAGSLSLSGGTFSPTGAGIVSGDFDVSGAVTSTLTNTLSADNANFTGAGSVTANNTLSLTGNLSMSDGTLNGTGLIDIGGDVSLTAAAAALSGEGRTIQVAGDWDEGAAVFIGDAGSGTGIVVFDGTAPSITATNSFYNLSVSGSAAPGGPITVDNDLSIGAAGDLDDSGNYTITVGGDWDNGSGGTFTAGSGSVVLNGSAQQIDAGGTNGRFYDLTVSAGTSATLSGSDLYVDNILAITGTSILDAAALNFSIVEIDFNADTDEFHLAGTQATQSITTADTANGQTVYNGAAGGTVRLSDFYDLSINGTGTFLVDPGDINIYGDLLLESGTLNGNAHTIRIQGDFDGSAGGSFAHGNGTVQYFGAVDAVISGDNTFYHFIADDTIETDLSDGALGKIIQIASGSTQSIAAGGTFQVRGDDTDPPNGGDPESETDWTLRTYTTSWITLKSTDDTAPPYWILELDGTATLDMQYVDVWFSYADPAVNVPDDTYVHACFDWLRFIYISDSFTRDTDDNGKIDIIEVVVAVNLDDNFTGFEVAVNGYEQSAAVDTGSTANDRAFWINLEEKSYLDTDATPSWYIVDSGSLRDSATGNYQVVHESPKGPSDPEVPWDDADPVIGYTLAAAGQNEVFIHFSESVYGSGAGGLLVAETDISGPAGNTVSSIAVVSGSGGGQEVLLTMTSPVSATDIAGGSLLTFANIDDNASDPTPVSPVWASQPDGPNSLSAATRRISDLGLASDSSGIMYPVWASDGTSVSSERGGLGLIRSFDGSDFLQDEDILLEATLHSDLASLGLSPTILYDGNVPSDYTGDSLWLPESANASGLVPYLYPDASTRSILGAAHPSGSTSLWQFTFPASDEDISTGRKLDFFLKTSYLGNDLYIARLDQPNASDWYRSVEPWSFRVQDLDQQTAQVSIFSNVINPLEGEKATLHYVLEDSGLVTITVFDLAGDLVNVLERGRKTAGEYSTTWDGRNRSGRVVARGIYFIRVVGPGFDEYRKVMVVK